MLEENPRKLILLAENKETEPRSGLPLGRSVATPHQVPWAESRPVPEALSSPPSVRVSAPLPLKGRINTSLQVSGDTNCCYA